jgi:hypothetical protein
MQYNKKPHPDESTVAETITPLRLNVPDVPNPLTLSRMRKTVPRRAMTPSNDSATTPGTRTPTISGRTLSVTGVEKEKWKTFRESLE